MYSYTDLTILDGKPLLHDITHSVSTFILTFFESAVLLTAVLRKVASRQETRKREKHHTQAFRKYIRLYGFQ